MPASADNSLNKLLQSVIDSTESGDWDGLAPLAEKLIPALQAIRASGPAKANDAPAIRQLLVKLQTAIDRCTERKEQIAPLLDALSPKTSSRDSV